METCDYNHLLLYAKGWYQRGSIIDDVRKIFGHRCSIEPQYITNRDVWEQLVSAFQEYCNEAHDTRSLLLDMFKPLAGECCPLSFWSDLSTFERMIHLILGHLGNVKVMGLGMETLYLGEPDPKVLPLSDSAKRRRNPYPGEPAPKETA